LFSRDCKYRSERSWLTSVTQPTGLGFAAAVALRAGSVSPAIEL
jgi:hypothetical protein